MRAAVVVRQDLGVRRHPRGDLAVGAVQQRGSRRQVLTRLCTKTLRTEGGVHFNRAVADAEMHLGHNAFRRLLDR